VYPSTRDRSNPLSNPTSLLYASAEHGRRRIARSSPITIGSALSDPAGALPYRVSYRSANRRFLPSTTPGIRRRRVHSEIRRHAPPRRIALGRNRARRRAISAAWMKAGQGAGSNIDAQDIVHASHTRRDLPKTRTRSNIFAGPAPNAAIPFTVALLLETRKYECDEKEALAAERSEIFPTDRR